MEKKHTSMTAPLNSNQSAVDNKDIESRYGNDYLKWKSWGAKSSFAKIKKTEYAYFRAEVKKTNHSFPAGSSVLEIGFGNGSFLTYAKENNWHICGTEINEDLVKTAIGCGFDVRHSDNLMAFDDNYFDLIVAFDVFGLDPVFQYRRYV